MTLHIDEGGAEISFRFKHDLDPDPWVVTFGVAAAPDSEPVTDFTLALNGCIESWSNNLRGVMDNQITLVEAQASIGHGLGPKGQALVAVGLAGGVSDTGLPQNCALLVRKTTAGVGRGSQGRFFWPGMIPRDKVNEVGALDSGLITALNTHFSDFLDDLEEAGPDDAPAMSIYVFHPDPETAPNRAISLSVDSTLSTQRRRLR